jgi:hypothetical protein
MIVFHRMEQYDIVEGGIEKPWLVIGWKSTSRYSRIFCIWRGGLWLRLRGNKRLCWLWSKPKNGRR